MTSTVISATALFCTDIREEVGGTHTVVGVLPDKIRTSMIGPGMLPQLAVYCRMSFPAATVPEKPRFFLRLSWSGDRIEVGPQDMAFVEAAARETAAEGAPITGMIVRATMSPFQLVTPGSVSCHLEMGGREIQLALLRFVAEGTPAPLPVPAPKRRKKI